MSLEQIYSALGRKATSSRLAGLINLENGVYAFSTDHIVHTFNDVVYLPAPYASLEDNQFSEGAFANSQTITFDGGRFISAQNDLDNVVNRVFQAVVGMNLRRRSVVLQELIMDLDTRLPVGALPKFSGRIERVHVNNEDPSSPQLLIDVVSHRVDLEQPVTRTLSNMDQLSVDPLDRSQQHASNTIFREAEFIWNRENAGTSVGSVNAGSGNGSFGTRNGSTTRSFNL